MPLLNPSTHSTAEQRGRWRGIKIPKLFLHTGTRLRLRIIFLIILLIPAILLLLFLLLAPYHLLSTQIWTLRICGASCSTDAVHIGILSACAKINGGDRRCFGGFPTNYWFRALLPIVPPLLRDVIPERDTYEGSFIIVSLVALILAVFSLGVAFHRMRQFRHRFREEEDYGDLAPLEQSSRHFSAIAVQLTILAMIFGVAATVQLTANTKSATTSFSIIARNSGGVGDLRQISSGPALKELWAVWIILAVWLMLAADLLRSKHSPSDHVAEDEAPEHRYAQHPQQYPPQLAQQHPQQMQQYAPHTPQQVPYNPQAEAFPSTMHQPMEQHHGPSPHLMTSRSRHSSGSSSSSSSSDVPEHHFADGAIRSTAPSYQPSMARTPAEHRSLAASVINTPQSHRTNLNPIGPIAEEPHSSPEPSFPEPELPPQSQSLMPAPLPPPIAQPTPVQNVNEQQSASTTNRPERRRYRVPSSVIERFYEPNSGTTNESGRRRNPAETRASQRYFDERRQYDDVDRPPTHAQTEQARPSSRAQNFLSRAWQSTRGRSNRRPPPDDPRWSYVSHTSAGSTRSRHSRRHARPSSRRRPSQPRQYISSRRPPSVFSSRTSRTSRTGASLRSRSRRYNRQHARVNSFHRTHAVRPHVTRNRSQRIPSEWQRS